MSGARGRPVAPGAEPVRGSPTLSCVLPVALREPGRHAWRHDPDAGVVPRLRLMLASFVRMFESAALDVFFIPCPPADRLAVEAIVGGITSDPRYRVVCERDLAPELFMGLQEGSGWYIQQILKLAVGAHVASPFYLTLDSDILCVRPTSYASLVHRGRARVNVERAADYAQLYVADTAAGEVRAKRTRFGWAERILGRPRPERYAGCFYGETPVVLHTASVRALLRHLEHRLGAPWCRMLWAHRPFTEYTLYFLFLELTGRLERVCERVDRRTVLDLDRSVWKGVAEYRRPRTLEGWSPFEGEDRGAFVAVQSYLDASGWLPAGDGVASFYARLERALYETSGDRP